MNFKEFEQKCMDMRTFKNVCDFLTESTIPNAFYVVMTILFLLVVFFADSKPIQTGFQVEIHSKSCEVK